MLSQEEMNLLVPEKLREIEKEYGIEILWAIESGSRAWDLHLRIVILMFVLFISERLKII